MIENNLSGKTPDIAEVNIKKLQTIFPDVFTDGKVDFEKLQQVLGNYLETKTMTQRKGKETFSLLCIL